MPSVASDSVNALPSRQPLPNSRSFSDASSSPPSGTFADMLDSAASSNDPAPAPARPDPSNSSDENSAPSQPREGSGANDSAAPKDAKSSGKPRDAKDANDGKASEATTTAIKGAAKKSKDGDAKSADAKDKAKTETDKTAALTVPTAPATPTAVTPIATTLDGTPAPAPADASGDVTAKPANADALASLQAAVAGGTSAPKDAGKAGPSQAASPKQTDGDQKPDASIKGEKPAAPQDVVPQAQAAKDGANKDGDKPAGDAHHAAADLLAKLDVSANAQTPPDAAKAGTDAVQNASAAAPVAATTAAQASTAPAPTPSTQAAAVPLAGLAVEITTQASAGKNHFEIRLDPPELGRIDVKLNVDRDGNVSTMLVADRQDTLDLLKRDQSTLERALQDSGLKTSDNGLQFSLRQDTTPRDDAPTQNTQNVIVSDNDPAPLEAMRQGYGRLLGLGGGLDIRV